MNVMLSSQSDRWFTPPHILELVRQVLGHIDLDPATDPSNPTGAQRFYTSGALDKDWTASTIYLNPPGGKLGNKSKVALFWDKLMNSKFDHAIFAMFSLNGLQTTQASSLSALDFPLCVPKKRVRWIDPLKPGANSPTHANAFVYVPQRLDVTEDFRNVFYELGDVT